jgi:dTMP kinase
VAAHDLVVVDRYVASNAAYGAARLYQDARGEFVAWVHDLEVGRFCLPVPDRHLLLDVPRAVAAERAAHRERTEPGRARDRYESDAALQDRTGAVYRGLAATGWLAPWTVLDGAAGVDAETLADDLLG